MRGSITIRGARTHNLKNISLDLPRGRLIVVTGVSGSGKSSLVFDTLYAEGQRRYVQSLSTYARLFLERMERPDVDSISDIPPALALRQKNTIKNARSTVGSVTEISDYLRLLFTTLGRTFCPGCGIEVCRDTVETAARRSLANRGLYLFLAPFNLGGRSLEEALAFLMKNGYHRLFHDEAIWETGEFLAAHDETEAPYRDGPLMVVIDRVAVGGPEAGARVREALERSFYFGQGKASAVMVERDQEGKLKSTWRADFSSSFTCSRCGRAFPEPTPALFSSNSPVGACPECQGFGRTVELDLDKVIPDPNLSLRQGVIAPWRTPAYREMQQWTIQRARRAGVRTGIPYREMTPSERAWLLDGDPGAGDDDDWERWPGVHGFFKWLERKRYKTHVRILLARYRRFVPCAGCQGLKLKAEALNVKIDGITIADIGRLAVRDVGRWVERISRKREYASRAGALLGELRNRIGYLNEVGLGYLTLERQARTLSGGEAQRIHLASALGSLLTGTLYALDEPTVGLHGRDTGRLLDVLRHLRDLGNTVVVVEHDPMMIAGADYLVELGPGGGCEGGELLRAGLAPAQDGARGAPEGAGRGLLLRALERERRFTRNDPSIRIVNAHEHNLRNLDVGIPLGRMVCVSGVSGSGKSTLVEDVLYKNYLRRTGETVGEVGACDRIEGLERLGGVVHMAQELPTRSTRSNPATYLKIYDEIRRLFASSADAKRVRLSSRHFSFNVEGGRCEKCRGAGTVTIEMHFMADLEVECDECDGRRFQSHILAIRFRGKNVNEVLDLTIDEARSFFADYATIVRRLQPLSAVGLGYLKLGQATSTLSGGEMQRLKLARCLLADLEPVPLSEDGTPMPRMFLLDEPTTGLSSTDIARLLRVLKDLVAEGNTLVVIEHNLEFIAQADYVIDLGPEGGDGGGKLVAAGSPVRLANCTKSYTGRELRRMFGLPAAGRAGAPRLARAVAAADNRAVNRGDDEQHPEQIPGRD